MRPNVICSVLAAALTTTTCLAAAREDLGRGTKLMILVDKVMQPTAGWTTEEWMVEATAEAGFNVFSPRRGHDRLDEVRLVTEWCEKFGIYHMPWMRGTLRAPNEPAADGKRLVWSSGNEQPLWSPNSDEFWQWTNRYIIEYAKISAQMPSLVGVFLDYENYAKGKQGNCYSLSYDNIIMRKFADAKSIDLPKLDLPKRKSWLDEKGLHDEFAEFQIDHWRERCRTLRKAVDEHNPTFQFCIYPAPGTPFMVEACYPEWATETAPIILADPRTYGRSSRFLPQEEALEVNRQQLLRAMEVPKQAGIPFIYAGGIDPVVRGADPEFSGKNAVMMSEVTDGYWIFYEGPKYDKDHPAYWKWFTWANQAISAGNFARWHESREEPEDWTLDVFGDTAKTPRVVPPDATGETVKYPIIRMRRDNMMFLACKAGQPVEVTLKNQPVAHYQSLLVWEIRDSRAAKLSTGTIPHSTEGVVAFTPEKDGIYLLGASAGSCAYSVLKSNVPIGLYADRGLSLIYGAKRLYFSVPAGLPAFTLSVRGSGAETVRLNVLNPNDGLAATTQTKVLNNRAAVKVSVGGFSGQTWSLEITRADEGVLEDNRIRLDPKLPPTLSLSREHVFGLASPK